MVGMAWVLIADDEPSFRESTAQLLRDDGYKCETVGDAHEALDRLRKKRYDVLVADIKMAGNADMRLARESRRLVPEMPIIVVTGYPSVDSAVDSVELRVAAYLRKPLLYEELRRHIALCVEHPQRWRALSEVQRMLRRCIRELEELKGSAMLRVDGGSPAPEVPPKVTVRAIAYCAFKLLALQASQEGGETPSLCQRLDCPQWPPYRDALRQAARLLESTKSRFKSKEVAAARELLERVLRKSEKPLCGD
ncbi:MAG TPA: response regulator [Planctomycetaceae bacterium]|nr:response regulator [Planctomycetaceae bacterium]